MARYLERLTPQAAKYTTMLPAKVFADVSLESTSFLEVLCVQSDSGDFKTHKCRAQQNGFSTFLM